MYRSLLSKTLLLSLVVATGPACANGSPEAEKAGRSDGSSYVASVDEWHDGRIQRLHRPDGWLSLVGLHSLDAGANTFGSHPDNRVVLPAKAPSQAGVLYVEADGFRVEAVEGVELLVDGQPIEEARVLSDATEAPTIIGLGTISFYVIERVGEPMLRVKDSEAPLLETFEGIERWPVDPRWRLDARFEPYDPPKPLKVPNVIGYVDEIDCHGAVVFEIAGETYRLDAQSPPGRDLFLVFGDATNGEESYGGGRFVYCEPPDENGRVVLDFNRAYNPPCVFTPFATCPLPSEEETLPVRITAGEKMWGGAH